VFSEAAPDAFRLLSAGNVKEHNALVAKAGERLVQKGCDTILLCQISMACAAAEMRSLNVPVLNSIDTGVKYIVQSLS
jgi:aspartate/glutamate racemase